MVWDHSHWRTPMQNHAVSGKQNAFRMICQWQIMSTTTLDYRMANMLGSILELWAKHRLIQSEIAMYSIQGFDGIIKQLMIKCICLMDQSECCLLNSWWFDDILSLVLMEHSTCKQVDLMEQSTCWWLISPFFSMVKPLQPAPKHFTANICGPSWPGLQIPTPGCARPARRWREVRDSWALAQGNGYGTTALNLYLLYVFIYVYIYIWIIIYVYFDINIYIYM